MKQNLDREDRHNSCSQVDSLTSRSNALESGDLDVALSNECEIESRNTPSDLTGSLNPKLERLKIQIRSALAQDPTTSAIRAFKLQLRLDYPELTAQEIHELWEAIAQELNRSQEQADQNDRLPTLMQVKQQRLVLADYLWGDQGRLAKQLTEIAQAMPTAPEFLLTTLIPAVGSRIGVETQIIIKPSARYVQPAIYRTLIVAPTGTKKTPAQAVILAALEALEIEEFNRWQTAQASYEKKLDQYEACLRRKQTVEERPLPPSSRKRYILGDSTIEARERIHQENPGGFLIYRDEGSAHFTSRNKYRRGIGDDAEAELSEFNGGAFTRDRKSSSLLVPRSAISRTGSIQWETLANLMKNHEDNNGEWSRWLFCAAPAPLAKIDLFSANADTNSEVYLALKQLYQKVDSIAPAQYVFSDAAKGIFQTAQHRLIDWMQEENQPGLKAAYPKFESYLARLALWLHLVNAALGRGYPAQEISSKTMVRATQLTTYFINQLRLIYAYNSPQQHLTGILLKMQAFAENKGCPVEVREFKSGVWSLRKYTTAQIRDNLSTLVQAGYGKWVDGQYQPFVADTQSILPQLFDP